MQKKELIDETFDAERSNSYILSIQASNKGFSFAIKDTVKESFIALYSYPFEKEMSSEDDWSDAVNALFSSHSILSRKFKKVFLSFESPLFTLIPADFFVPEKASQMYSLVWDLPDLYELHFKESSKMVLLFAVPSSLITKVKLRQPNVVIVGHAQPLLNLSTVLNTKPDDVQIYANLSDSFVVNVIVQNKEIKNCTPYRYTNADDLTYFLISACKPFSIVPGDSTLTLTNVAENQDSLVQLLTKFFRKVNVDKGFQGDHYAYSIEKYRTQYWNLFNNLQCE